LRVLVVYSGNSVSGHNPIVENQVKSLISKGVEIELFPIVGKGLSGYSRNIRNISKYLKKNRCELVHAHYGLSAIVAFLAKKNEPLIVSFMGDDLVGSNRINGAVKVWSKLLIKINTFLARYLYDYSIIKSAEMAKKLRQSTLYSLIPNGVNLDDFFPISQTEARKILKLSEKKKIVLFVSNPNRAEKNYALADSAVKTLNDPELSLITVYSIPFNVLNLYYNSADLLLMTSFHEGSPNVVKEAMACNCPVVSTRVGDVNWLFGETPGYYITTYESLDVAEKIKSAIKYRMQNEFTSGRERIRELGLDSVNISDKILAVYQRVFEKA